MASTPARTGPTGTVITSRPTTLSARAAQELARGPLDPQALMRVVCGVDQLKRDAAERMAVALLGSHPEFLQLPTGLWALREPPEPSPSNTPTHAETATGAAPARSAPGASGKVGRGAMAEGEAALTLLAQPFAVVDVETTGTHANGGDRITEIAIVHVDGGEIVDRFTTLVNPERTIPPYITSLTQISWAMVKDELPFRRRADEVAERLRGRVFVAHNAAFDWRFVGAEMARCDRQLSGPTLCTVRLARRLLPELPRRSLDVVARHFGVEITARHRAAGDAEATAVVLVRLLQMAAELEITTWPQLEQWLGTSTSGRRSAADRRRRAFPHFAPEDPLS
ncbi:MAG: exonuclease domain-containing protein [Gemmatimonadaceae bacterium]